MPKKLRDIWEIEDMSLPVSIILENRRNSRVGITSKGVIIRLPRLSLRTHQKEFIKWSYDWVIDQLKNNLALADSFKNKKYLSGQVIVTPYMEYVLDISTAPISGHKARLKGKSIFIQLAEDDHEVSRREAAQALIGRIIGKHQKGRVTQRIIELNDKHFRVPINDVKLKNNTSNWGSCSAKGNINISTRTLLAPFEVQDYIFIHELAHRLEMNHSPKYWEIVHRAMPTYEKHELWLKKYGKSCQF